MRQWLKRRLRRRAARTRRVGIERLEDRRQLAADGDRDDQISEPLVRIDLPSRKYRVTEELSSAGDVDMVIVNIAQGMAVDFDIDSEKQGLVGPATYLRLFDQNAASWPLRVAAKAHMIALWDWTRICVTPSRIQAVTTSAFLRSTTRTTILSPARVIQPTAFGPSATTLCGMSRVIEEVEVPDAIATTFPYNSLSPPYLGLGYSQAMYGRISSLSDVDIYFMPNVNLRMIDFDIDAVGGDTGGVDTYLRLFDYQGNEIASNDNGLAPGDSQLGKDSFLRYEFTKVGSFFLGISSSNNRDYNLFQSQREHAWLVARQASTRSPCVSGPDRTTCH